MSVEQMEFLDLAARVLGPAIENAVLQIELADRANRLAMLERMALSINSGLDVPSVFTACQSGLRELLDCEDICLAVFTPSQIADVYSFHGGDALIHTRQKLSRERLRMFKAMAEAQAGGNPSDMPPCEPGHEEHGFDSGSVALSPLIYKNSVIGLLKTWSTRGLDTPGGRGAPGHRRRQRQAL
jgi:hypothetical protein